VLRTGRKTLWLSKIAMEIHGKGLCIDDLPIYVYIMMISIDLP
jgi:hypothetical protein